MVMELNREGQLVDEEVTIFPPSFAQQRLWFMDRLDGANALYNIPAAVRLTGKLDVLALEKSLQTILDRHEVLRTGFALVSGELVQAIAPRVEFPLNRIDLQHLPESIREAQGQKISETLAQQEFNLSRPPLLRGVLIQLSDRDWMLALTMHHIISDGWSIGIFIRELSALYAAFSKNQPSPLPELPIQYADFAIWQRDWLQKEVLEAQLTYWKQQLGGSLPVLELPTDQPRPPVQTFRGANQVVQLPKSLSESLGTLSQQQGVTLYMTLLAAFKTLLARYSGQEDILVGSPIANRNRQEIEPLIGFFVNTLVLRTNLSDNPTFSQLLAQVRDVTLGAYAHQDLPFEKLVEALQPERDLSRSPIFQVMFVLQNAPVAPLELPGVRFQPIEHESGTAKYDLTLYVRETEAGLQITWEYNTDLFEPATIQRMQQHWQTLLEAVATDPETPISHLPLLTPREEQQLLIQGNQTQADYPQTACLQHLFEVQVQRTPDAVAVEFAGDRLTYRELNIKANQLAHYLQEWGVQPNQLVGLYVERSLDMVIALLGILKAGGAYLPLDPAYPSERLQFTLADAGVSVLLTHQHLVPQLPSHQARVLCLDTDGETLAQCSPENPLSLVHAEDLAYTIYTSGSTGKPKGVEIPHLALVNFLTSMQREPGLTSEDILLSVTTLSFDIAALELFLPLIVGAQLVLVSREVATDGIRLAQTLNASGTTVMQATPATWRLLLSAGWEGSNSLKILCGGEALDSTLAQQLQERCAELWNMYGPTETTIWSLVYRVEQVRGMVPIGRPIANTQVYVLDSHLQPVPQGVAGELYIGGDGLARGYLHRPELTQEKFISNPYNPDSRLYKTGDLVRYLANGNLEFIARIDTQIKLRGHRIELGEIEAVLAQHPQVLQAVVVLREERLVAYWMKASGDLAFNDLKGFLKTKLPAYMVPAVFVELETLPLTPNGKIDRKALPIPDLTGPQETWVAPRTPLEIQLAELWSEVLGIERIGLYDSFFELGGHSLLATQLMSRIREAFQVELPLKTLFEAPTLANLTEHIETAMKAELGLEIPAIVPASREGELPLSFAQQRLWFLDRLEPDSASYNIPCGVRLTGNLNPTTLEHCVTEILRRHEILRTQFVTVNGQPVQQILPATPFTLPVIDLQGLSPEDCEVQVRRITEAEARQGFNLECDRLLRGQLLQVGETSWILLFTLHHIVSDAWSAGVLVQELSALYAAFTNSQPSPLAELPIQYADFALWQQNWLQGAILETQLGYWKQQLGGSLPVLELQTDKPRPPVQTFRGSSCTVQLPKSLNESLHGLSQKQGVTLYMTLLAAFKTLLARYSGQENILVGSPIANRNRREIEPLIGFFVNTLVLRTDLSDNPTFSQLLTRVREVTLGAYAHQDLPFEKLVEALQPERDLSRSPLFQVMFVLQNAPVASLELPALRFHPLERESGTAKYDLTLYVRETEAGLEATWEYNTDLFEPETIQRMQGHWQTLLEAVATAPDTPIAHLPLLTSPEEQELLIQWNQTQMEYPETDCLHHLFEAQVQRTPDAVAVEFEGNQLTYQDLNTKANQLAHYLQGLGVGPNQLVALYVERSLDMAIALLGILKAGGAYLPLDPAYPSERLQFTLADAGVSVLLTHQHLVSQLPHHQAQVICLDADGDSIALSNSQNPLSPVHAEDLAYIIYTSGSTGKPKGVEIPHRALVNFLTSMQQQPGLNCNDILLSVTTLSFDIAALELFGPLIVGAKLVLVSREVAIDGRRLSQTLTASDATVMQATPATWRLLLAAGWEGSSSLKILCGGEALDSALAQQLQDRCGELWNMYGPTETTIWSLVYRVEQLRGMVSIGRPIANTQVYVLDSHLQPVPVGVPGELYIGGDGLARGYLNRPDLTAERFIPHPYKPGSRLYKTGDLVRYLPKGYLEFIARLDNQVKLRGYRIELGEIEAVLAQHPQVQQAVVVLREERLVAYWVKAGELTPTIAELQGLLKTQLPAYMLPTAFVELEGLPLTPNGKVDRKVLPMPDRLSQSRVSYEAPRTEIEQAISLIWERLLCVERVGIHDNFFDIGGHSLLLMEVHQQLQKTLNREFPLVTLFQYPTIANLADYFIPQQNQVEGHQESADRATHRVTAMNRRKHRRNSIKNSDPYSND